MQDLYSQFKSNRGERTHLYLAFIFAFWILVFAIHRFIFLTLNARSMGAEELNPFQLLQTFTHGFSLDLSMAAYCTTAVWMILFAFVSFPQSFSRRWANCLTALLILSSTILAIGDAFLYPEWKSKINSMVLVSLQRPSEVWRVTAIGQFFSALLLTLLLSAFLIYLFYRLQKNIQPAVSRPSFRSTLFLFIWPVLLGMTARGGLNPTPINVSRVYFSKIALLNDAATNTAWFFILDLSSNGKFLAGNNPFSSMTHEEAQATLLSLKQPRPLEKGQATRVNILRKAQPNIVYIVLESWSADLVAELGGDAGITPHFSKLTKEGLLFTKFYANGNRSQQGMASIFSGFPALPLVTITENPSKVKALPRFAEGFAQSGYQTDFFYGGNLEYGNIRSFLVANGFQTITEDDQLKGLPRGSLGVADGDAAPAYAQHLGQLKEPFLSAFFTLSTHAPFDFPEGERFTWSGQEPAYVRSAMYADEALGKFFATVKQEAWYENTLFILVADHSHPSYRPRENWQPSYRRIPMLMLGGALEAQYRGKTWDKVGSQVDITSTVLHQLGKSSDAYEWGHDLLDRSTPSFAYFETNRGVGWIEDEGELVYDRESDTLPYNTFADKNKAQALKRAQAYLQSVVDLYLKAKPSFSQEIKPAPTVPL